MTFLAHITGFPHHAEETQSLLALWPLVLLALQLIWVIAKQRTRQVAQIVLQGLREARPFFAAIVLLVGVYALVSVTHAAPLPPVSRSLPPVVLRGPTGQVLGTIETASTGIQELRGARRQLLGTYSPQTNQTRDASNRLVGHGNLLAILLRN